MRRFVNKIERADVNLPCGTVAEEIGTNCMIGDVVGGSSDRRVLDYGDSCTLTNECQNYTGVVHYSQWGAFCK